MEGDAERLRTLAFARLVGHLLSDGSISVMGQGRMNVGQALVFISAAYKNGAAALRLSGDSYQVVWKDDAAAREKAMETHWSTAAYRDGHLYGFSGRHENEATLTCLELATGKVRWRWESYLGRGSFIQSDGLFITLGERGDLALLKLTPEGHEEFGDFVAEQIQGLSAL